VPGDPPQDIKAAHGAARAADTAARPTLPLTLPATAGLMPVGWRERHTGFGAAETQAVARAAADLTREPSRRPSSGSCGQARSQPHPRTSVRAAAPCQIRRSVGANLPHCRWLPPVVTNRRSRRIPVDDFARCSLREGAHRGHISARPGSWLLLTGTGAGAAAPAEGAAAECLREPAAAVEL